MKFNNIFTFIKSYFPLRTPHSPLRTSDFGLPTPHFALLAISIFFTSCDSKIEAPKDFGHEYFPLELGQVLVYQLDSIVYDTTGLGTVIDTTKSFLKEEIIESFENNSGGTTYRIERSKKKNLADPWKLVQSWSAEMDDTRAFRTEDNLRFVKMVFPIAENTTWDGNVFIDKETILFLKGESVEIFKNWEYKIDSVDEAEMIGDFSFDKVTTISQADSENLIELRFSKEKYAKGVGLVYKEMRILDTQNISETISWEEKAQKGFILVQTLIQE